MEFFDPEMLGGMGGGIQMGGMGSPFGGLGGFFGGGRRRGPPRGEDTVHKLKVSLEDLYVGKVSKLQLSKNTICTDCNGIGGHGPVNPCGECRGRGIRVTVNQIGPGMVQQMQSKCDSCDGEGEVMAAGDRCSKCEGRKVVPEIKLLEVNVEPGMRDSQKIVFRGEGNQMPGVEPGNVLIVLQEKPHAEFKREGADLFMRINLTLTEALCGFRKTIKHLDNRKLLVTQRPGEVIKPNTMKVISGEGMPAPSQQGHVSKGDLFISFSVDFPENYFAPENKMKVVETLLGGRPAEIPIPMEHEEVSLVEVEERGRRAHDEDDDDDEDMRGHHGHPGVQCAQQ